MSLFLDASAVVAVLAQEPEAGMFDRAITGETVLLTSAVAVWEASRGVANARGVPFEEARELVSAYIREFDVQLVGIGTAEAALALDAHQHFGKGRHAASLNMGDCFAYACAKTNDARLLYEGDDFIHTDLA